MIEIHAVPPHLIEPVCNVRRDILEKAAEASTETPESLIELGKTGMAICWAAIDGKTLLGLVFAQILLGPKGKKLMFLALGGEQGARWFRQAREVVEQHARTEGATEMIAVRIGGRKTCFGMKPKGFYYEEKL